MVAMTDSDIKPKFRMKRHIKRQSNSLNTHAVSKEHEPTMPLALTTHAWLILQLLWRCVCEALDNIGDDLMPGLHPFEFDPSSASDLPPKT